MLFSRLVRPCWLRRTVTVASLPSLLALMAMWCAQPSPSRSRTWLREPPNASPWLKPGLTMNQRTGVIGNALVKCRPRLRLTLLRLEIGQAVAVDVEELEVGAVPAPGRGNAAAERILGIGRASAEVGPGVEAEGRHL